MKVREKSRNLNTLSESKNSAIPYVQSECQFNQNTISRSQGKFCEVREKSGKSQGKVREKSGKSQRKVREKSGKMKMEKVATLYDIRSYVRYVI